MNVHYQHSAEHFFLAVHPSLPTTTPVLYSSSQLRRLRVTWLLLVRSGAQTWARGWYCFGWRALVFVQGRKSEDLAGIKNILFVELATRSDLNGDVVVWLQCRVPSSPSRYTTSHKSGVLYVSPSYGLVGAYKYPNLWNITRTEL